MLNRLFSGNVANNPCDRWDQRIGICRSVNEKTPPKDPALVKRVVDSNDGLGNDVFIVNIRGNTDDAVWGYHTRDFAFAAAGILQHGVGPIDMPIHGILIGKHALGKSLTDDDHGLAIRLAIERVEIAAGNNGNAQRRKKSRRDATRQCPWVFYAGGMDVPVSGEL